MEDEAKIEDLKKRIDELTSEMAGFQQKLFALREELNRSQKKEITSDPRRTPTFSQHFKIENFIGLRVIHFVGIIVLLIGLSIGVKYAIDEQLISEGLRIILAYAAGMLLYILSWRSKKNYQLFSAILFSGGMASLYFTTYAAFVYYGFFSFAVTYLLMVGFTIYTAIEAIRYNRQEIAVLGMVGAYGIPFLISANSERVDLFFSYIILINIGIVYLSFRKKWRIMDQFAMVVSWTLFIFWGFFRYEGKDVLTGSILLSIFYFLFIVSALAYRLFRSESLTFREIQQVALNNIALYISALLVFGYGKFGTHLALITGCVFVFILILTAISFLAFRSETMLHDLLAIQAIILLTLFVGFNWSGLLVTLLWIALAAIIFIFGVYNQRSWPRLVAMSLMGVTLGKLIIFDSSKFTTIQKIIAYLIIGVLLLVLSFLYQKNKQKFFQSPDETQGK
ncbi:MAG TPA: DUF2339 domain-containing protein [Chitinophagaceae bacterium]|nr:DUF2339 domain-containing protein [Chitinophagaceae bacterium]